MAHPQEIRQKLRQCYVFDGHSLEIAALQANVAFGTARRWKADAAKNGDDWDKVRAAHVLAGGGIEDLARSILSGFLLQYNAVVNEIQHGDAAAADKVQMLTALADAFNKTIAANKKILPETSQLATAMQVLQELGEFVANRYPQHLAAFAELLEPFGEEVQKRFG